VTCEELSEAERVKHGTFAIIGLFMLLVEQDEESKLEKPFIPQLKE